MLRERVAIRVSGEEMWLPGEKKVQRKPLQQDAK